MIVSLRIEYISENMRTESYSLPVSGGDSRNLLVKAVMHAENLYDMWKSECLRQPQRQRNTMFFELWVGEIFSEALKLIGTLFILEKSPVEFNFESVAYIKIFSQNNKFTNFWGGDPWKWLCSFTYLSKTFLKKIGIITLHFCYCYGPLGCYTVLSL